MLVQPIFTEVLGRLYPMTFSMFAFSSMSDKYGGMKEWEAAVKSSNLNAVVDLMQGLIASGCEYCNRTGLYKTHPKLLAEWNGEKITPPTTTDILLSMQSEDDVQKLVSDVTEVMEKQGLKTIQTKPVKKKKKRR